VGLATESGALCLAPVCPPRGNERLAAYDQRVEPLQCELADVVVSRLTKQNNGARFGKVAKPRPSTSNRSFDTLVVFRTRRCKASAPSREFAPSQHNFKDDELIYPVPEEATPPPALKGWLQVHPTWTVIVQPTSAVMAAFETAA
jgi:hypothetical protein